MTEQVVLAARGVTKRYGALTALNDVDFELNSGEVHALIGQNGAGKSTLVGLLSGGITPDEGVIEVLGHQSPGITPEGARRARIRVIHQERQLCHHLTVAENVHLGSLPTHRGDVVDWRRAYATAATTLSELGVDIDPRGIVGDLTRAEQQIVEIARAVHEDAAALLMDEPTAALSQVEADRLLDLVSRLRETGTGIIYISHQLGEIQRLSDRVTVLRDGSNIGTFDPRDRTLDQLGALMLGNVVESVGDLKARSAEPGPVVLEVRNLQAKGVAKIDFEVRQGEIIAITGLLGSGYLEVGLTLFGAQPTHGGQILLEGEPLVIRNPAHACALGFAFVPPDRKKQGVLTDLSIAENVTLPTVAAERRPWVTRRWTGDFATKALRPLRVRAESINSSPATLSGGNQQKLVFAKWTGRSARLLILAEPTSGIDVGAKEEIFKIIDSLACAGSAVVLVSSDFGEVARIATRVLVMRRGRFDREVGHSELSADRLFALASR